MEISGVPLPLWARTSAHRGCGSSVASPADLARTLSALRRAQDISTLRDVRRLIELDRGLSIER
jgi:hypothetical protein